jgi:hypothetical protein
MSLTIGVVVSLLASFVSLAVTLGRALRYDDDHATVETALGMLSERVAALERRPTPAARPVRAVGKR